MRTAVDAVAWSRLTEEALVWDRGGSDARLCFARGGGSLKSFRLKLREVRSWPVEGFPNHLVYYRFTPNALIVPAVIHGSGDVSRILRRRRP